jgi:hypothetical protein
MAEPSDLDDCILSFAQLDGAQKILSSASYILFLPHQVLRSGTAPFVKDYI